MPLRVRFLSPIAGPPWDGVGGFAQGQGSRHHVGLQQPPQLILKSRPSGRYYLALLCFNAKNVSKISFWEVIPIQVGLSSLDGIYLFQFATLTLNLAFLILYLHIKFASILNRNKF